PEGNSVAELALLCRRRHANPDGRLRTSNPGFRAADSLSTAAETCVSSARIRPPEVIPADASRHRWSSRPHGSLGGRSPLTCGPIYGPAHGHIRTRPGRNAARRSVEQAYLQA